MVLPFCCRCFRVSTDAAGHQSLQINIVYWTYLVNPGPSTAFAVPVGTYAQTNGLLIWSYQTTYMGSGSTRRQCCLLNAPCLNLDKSIGPEEASDEGERMSLTSLKSYCALPLAGVNPCGRVDVDTETHNVCHFGLIALERRVTHDARGRDRAFPKPLVYRHLALLTIACTRPRSFAWPHW